jgi:dipeptidase E
VKLLLTSGGVTNASIHRELESMLDKPIGECHALIVPTAQWGHPMCSPQSVWRSVSGTGMQRASLVGLGWASVGLLELSVLPSIDAERWQSWVRDADALLTDGGDAVYLAHRMRESGLADLLPALTETVWVGVSAGSMVLTPRVGRQFLEWRPEGDDRTLGAVEFSIFPHLDFPGWDENTSESARRWAADIGAPAYAIDDQTAIAVEDGLVRVVSEGSWLSFGIDGESPPQQS